MFRLLERFERLYQAFDMANADRDRDEDSHGNGNGNGNDVGSGTITIYAMSPSILTPGGSFLPTSIVGPSLITAGRAQDGSEQHQQGAQSWSFVGTVRAEAAWQRVLAMAHLSTLEGFVYGGPAGCTAVTFSNPAEVAKTRLQLQGELMRSGSGERVYKNVFNVLLKTWRNEGFRGVQRVLGPADIERSRPWEVSDIMEFGCCASSRWTVFDNNIYKS
uniref:Dynamin-A n=1 Tax=Ganoderma boninense TaxID=34458 RepID=A0A5K1K680_9APHY|nr:Dynamin-A [Ganoderma boninense]